jgi:hypothetical protein
MQMKEALVLAPFLLIDLRQGFERLHFAFLMWTSQLFVLQLPLTASFLMQAERKSLDGKKVMERKDLAKNGHQTGMFSDQCVHHQVRMFYCFAGLCQLLSVLHRHRVLWQASALFLGPRSLSSGPCHLNFLPVVPLEEGMHGPGISFVRRK